jgi:hypothetical protein
MLLHVPNVSVNTNPKVKFLIGATIQILFYVACVYQMAQFFSRIHLMSTFIPFSRGAATQPGGGIVQTRNRNESGGLMSWVSEKWQKWRSHPVSQCSYIDADPNITSYKVIFNSVIERSTKTPYTFKFHDPVHIITGIACVPKDAVTSSPEAEVVRGGVGCKEVEIRLTPVDKGNWCCCVRINGIEDNRLQMDSSSH